MKISRMILFLFLIIFTIGINWLNFKESLHQPWLNSDFTEGKLRYSMDKVAKVNLNFPSIDGTTQPIKMLIGRYYKNIDSIDKAKRLFKSAIKDNPYIKSPEAQLAYLYFEEEKFDSAFFYAKDAFYTLPNNNVHRDIYFRTLVKRKDTVELKRAFEVLMSNAKSNRNHWLNYFDSKIQLVDPYNPEILQLIDEFEKEFPSYDKTMIEGIKTVAKSNIEDLSFGAAFAEMADKFYKEKNYKEAALHFEFALQYAKEEYPYYENAAISYYLDNQFSKASEYFDKVIYDFKSRDGKSEFYKGIMLIELDSLDKGCKFLEKAVEKNFSDSSSIDVYNNFCN